MLQCLSIIVVASGMHQDIEAVMTAMLQAHQECGDAQCRTRVLTDAALQLNSTRDAVAQLKAAAAAPECECDCGPTEPDTVEVTGSVGKAHWGMGRKQIRKAYGKVKVAEHGGLLRASTVAGLPAEQHFSFTSDDRLAAIRNYLTTRYRTPKEYTRKYAELRGMLSAKYGEPVQSGGDWLDPFFREHPEHHGTALKQGHVRYSAGWVTPETLVEIHLYAQNGRIWIETRYFSAALQPVVRAEQQTQQLGDL